MRIFTRLSKAMIFVAIASLLQHAHAARSVSGIVNAEMKPGESDQQLVQRIAKGDLIKAGRDQPQIARTSKLLRISKSLSRLLLHRRPKTKRSRLIQIQISISLSMFSSKIMGSPMLILSRLSLAKRKAVWQICALFLRQRRGGIATAVGRNLRMGCVPRLGGLRPAR